jgi:4-carboxymuconolactone decarboxylase
MNDERRRQEGMKVRRAVLGDSHVDRAAAKLADPLQAEFQDLITRYAWGEIWTPAFTGTPAACSPSP